MTEPDRTALTQARSALQAARDAFVSALYTDQQSPGASNDSALATARANMSQAQTNLNLAIGTWLAGTDVTNDGDISRLDAIVPIVLLPVRIETRFSGATLQVRVFPDEIFLDRHEKALTLDEVAAGQVYYNAGAAGQPDQWRQMVAAFGAPRSAYILRALTPDSGGNFPTVLNRSSTWTRPGEAVLPDRWVVMTRRGNTRGYHAGLPIPEPLSMTPDPSAAAADQSPLPNSYAIDGKLLWTVDFQTAVNVGMALSIPLSTDDQTLGFDRIVVFGVKTSMTGTDSVLAFEHLVDAHHYTRGVAFVRQDSVTNNTKDRPTAYPPADEAGQVSFALERQPPPVPGDPGDVDLGGGEGALPDGFYWTQILGVHTGVVQNVDRAGQFEHVLASAMNRVMWPLTYRSFLKFSMASIFSDTAINNAEGYFVDNVLARGPAPAFRVGQVPYGLLPVTSLQRWQKDTTDTSTDVAVETAILDPLQRALGIWKNASSGVKRVLPQSSTPDLDLIGTLALYPTMRELRIRFGFGGLLVYHLFNFLGWDVSLPFDALDQATIDLFQRLGHPEWRPRLGRTIFLPFASLETTALVDLDKNLSETAGLNPNYLTTLLSMDKQLVGDQVPGKPNPEPLLYQLLQISMLTKYALEADQILIANEPTIYVPWPNGEVFGLTNLPVGSVIGQLGNTFPFTGSNNLAQAAKGQSFQFTTAFAVLAAAASTAELDRLIREALDVASHRVDPWATAFAYRRLVNIRETNTDSPNASHLGAYAWVEDVRPVGQTSGTGPDGNPADVDPTNGGFIHCPGATHAMAAAALRSGYLSFSGEDPQKYAVDLSSRRVRNATQILDEMRDGQHAGAVLGYRFERALQDANATVPGLNTVRFAFRKVYPLVAGKNGVDTSQPADTVAARNVVDGLALYRAFRAGTIPFGSSGLPSAGSAQYNTVVAELNQLVALVDSVADILTAEGVYQLALGNLTGAPASLDNMVGGGVPPSPQIARSPRVGVGLSHRVIYVLPTPSSTALPAAWTAPVSPRSSADPVLNQWVATIIGDPTKVTAQVSFTDASGTANHKSISLQALAVQPLDVLALARVLLEPNQGSLLDARIIFAAVGDDATNTGVTIDYTPQPGRNPSVDRTFPEIIEIMGTLVQTLGGSRPLAPPDLRSPTDTTGMTQDPNNVPEMNARLTAVFTSLNQAITDLQTATPASFDPATASTAQINALRSAIREGAAIAPERAYTTLGESPADLFAAAVALLTELLRRKTAATGTAPSDADGAIQFVLASLKTILGSDMFAMPPVDVPTTQITAAFNARTTLLNGDETAPGKFLQQAAHGRAQLAKYRKFALYARALGSTPPRLDVAQLPPNVGEQWLALPFTTAPTQSRTSLLLLTLGAQPPETGTWRGIVVDTWTEIIPGTTQPTSVAFNHNSPRAEAPQCILVAVPPNVASGQKWSTADLVATLEETLDLAQIRAVDRDLLDIGQLVPAIVIPSNLDQAITTSSAPIGVTVSVPSIFSQGFL